GAAPAAGARPASATSLVPTLVGDDLEKSEPPLTATLDDFLLFLSVRFLRAVEKLVAYTAREFIEVLDMRTILPDESSNFRLRVGELLTAPNDAAQRRALDD